MPNVFFEASWSLTLFGAILAGFIYAFAFWVVQVVVERVVAQQHSLQAQGVPAATLTGRMAALLSPRLAGLLAVLPMFILPFVAVWITLPRVSAAEAMIGGMIGIQASGVFQQILHDIIVRRERRRTKGSSSQNQS